MKIAEIHIYQHDLPVKNGPYAMANAEVWALDTTLVKLVADNGQTGWGETCPVGPTYAESHAAGARAALIAMGEGLVGAEVAPGDPAPADGRAAERPQLRQGRHRHCCA